MRKSFSVLRGDVLILGIVSLLTDLSSEMIYPLLPVFFTALTSASAAAVTIGWMDGLAEATASVLKIYAGRLSDRWKTRKKPALLGYGLSAAARPLMAFLSAPWQGVLLRVLDRVGKGIRTAPRDAWLAAAVPAADRGLAFSFHRAMDHLGAVGGPVLSLLLLSAFGQDISFWNAHSTADSTETLRKVFLFAAVPGFLGVWVLARLTSDVGVSEPPLRISQEAQPSGKLSRKFKTFLAAVGLFTLGNSSDLFLLFYVVQKFAWGAASVVFLWVLLHISKVIFSLPAGRLGDVWGKRRMLLLGWGIYVLVYGFWSFCEKPTAFLVLIVLYGAYYGFTEGVERALVADFAPPEARGKAFGLYHGVVGLAALPASACFGIGWALFGPTPVFLVSAAFATAAACVLIRRSRA